MIPGLGLIVGAAKWVFGKSIDGVLTTIRNGQNTEAEKKRIESEVLRTYANAQVQLLTGRGWWFPLFFIVPVGTWFGAICVYSLMFCAGCAFPQDWTIAALPPPLDEWAGWIVSSLFVTGGGQVLLEKYRRTK